MHYCNYLAWISIIEDSSKKARGKMAEIMGYFPNKSQTSKPLAFGSLFLCLDHQPSFPLKVGYLYFYLSTWSHLWLLYRNCLCRVFYHLLDQKFFKDRDPHFFYSPALCKLGLGWAAVLHKDLLKIEESIVNHEVNMINIHTPMRS